MWRFKNVFNQQQLTNDPLDPDHIIASTLRYKVLQAPAEVVAHSLTRLSQVGLGFVQELLCDIHHVHGAEERQQQAFGDSPNTRSTVQGTTLTCFPLPLLQQKTQDISSQLKMLPSNHRLHVHFKEVMNGLNWILVNGFLYLYFYNSRILNTFLDPESYTKEPLQESLGSVDVNAGDAAIAS